MTDVFLGVPENFYKQSDCFLLLFLIWVILLALPSQPVQWIRLLAIPQCSAPSPALPAQTVNDVISHDLLFVMFSTAQCKWVQSRCKCISCFYQRPGPKTVFAIQGHNLQNLEDPKKDAFQSTSCSISSPGNFGFISWPQFFM